MTSQKVTLKQWEQFSKEISVSKQTVQELSKLYIIIHQKVKSTIKNSVINPNANFSSQIQHHIEFIQNILQKIKSTQNDLFLVDIEKSLLKKYQKSLLGLLNQIQTMLKVQQSKLNLANHQLKAIKPQKPSEYDLRNQIKQSGKRIVRAKSGYKPSRSNHNQNTEHKKLSIVKKTENDEGSFFPTTIQVQSYKQQRPFKNINGKNIQAEYESKRQKLAQIMRKSMSPTKSGLGVSFQNKYEDNYLEMYFNERKQFADLIFNQEVYNQIILNNHLPTQMPEIKSMDSNIKSLKGMKVDDVNNKLFPQFQIKTKFLKPAVKSKISNLITDVKKELMKEYFLDNIQRIKSINQKQKSKPQVKKNTSLSTKTRSQSLSHIPIQRSKQSTSYVKQRDEKQQNQKFRKTDYFPKKQVKTQRSNSYSELNRNISNLTRSKKSFVNNNSKPFYQTQKWNQQIQKKYSSKIMSKLLKAKLT